MANKEYFLTTDRLGFTKWQDNDFDKAKSLWGEGAVSKYIRASGRFTDLEIKNRLANEICVEKHSGVQYWPMYHLKTHDFIGCCGLHFYNKENNIYEIGIHLKEEYWGQGIASEAMQAVVNHAFTILKAENILADHNPKNIASKKLLTSLGFQYIGDEFFEPTGLFHPSYLYK